MLFLSTETYISSSLFFGIFAIKLDEDKGVINLHLKKAKTGLALFLLASDLATSFGKSATDNESSMRGTERITNKVAESYKEGSALWSSVADLFGEIYSHA